MLLKFDTVFWALLLLFVAVTCPVENTPVDSMYFFFFDLSGSFTWLILINEIWDRNQCMLLVKT